MVELLKVLLTVVIVIYCFAMIVYYNKVRNSEPERNQTVFIHSTVAGAAIALFVVWFWMPAFQSKGAMNVLNSNSSRAAAT